MTAQNITEQLRSISAADDFAARTAELTDAWSAADAGIETVEPILRFMEEYPTIDFGTPGALVHFVERFLGPGYEEELVASIGRKPTSHTVWMLNRVINGTKAPDVKQRLIATMGQVRLNPRADQSALETAERFLARLSH